MKVALHWSRNGVGSRFRGIRFPCGLRAPSGGPIGSRSALGTHTVVAGKRLPTAFAQGAFEQNPTVISLPSLTRPYRTVRVGRAT